MGASGRGAGARAPGRRLGLRARAALAAVTLLLLASAARAQERPLAARVHLDHAQALVGETVGYRAFVTLPSGIRARWQRPDSVGAYEFSDLAARRTAGPGVDTLWVEATVRAWVPGGVAIAGPAVEVQGLAGTASYRLPAARLEVASVLDKAQPAELRPVRAPLPAPWWERVPWRWLAGALVAVVALALAWRALRRRPAPPQPEAVPDPAAEALAALAELRARRLPEQGRFAEHAFGLGRILRRFLEATVETARPGDSTPELVGHLEQARLAGAELERMHGLLTEWDQIKFARRPATREQALRAEQAVERFVRDGPRLGQAA